MAELSTPTVVLVHGGFAAVTIQLVPVVAFVWIHSAGPGSRQRWRW